MEYIDINAYVGHWPFQQLQYNDCRGMLQQQQKFGVDLSVISNLEGVFYKNTQSANLELYNELKSDSRFYNRFIPFAVINPTYAGWRDDLQACIKKLGMKGVRMYPKYHDYEITDAASIELVKRARDLGVPVALDMRMVDSRERSWMDINQEWALKNITPLIKAVPDARYMIVNFANAAISDDDVDVLKASDCIIDTSGRSITHMGEFLNKFGSDKFGFGTHAPILDYLTGKLRIESLRPTEADEQTKNLLRSGNAKKFLGI
jgi:predicted TIM-barrel fold metal-dependent hydrolase